MILYYNFNSSMVRLKVHIEFTPVICNINFNSSMVRLKARMAGSNTCLSEFQFQYGAIEGVNTAMASLAYLRFQFQYGAIEGFNRMELAGTESNFNSSMVRLKACFDENMYWNDEISIPVWCD